MLDRVERILDGASNNGPPLVLSGHQPEIFHNGVWFKNGVISKLANLEEGIAINLIIDHDLPKHVGVNVPVLAGDQLVSLRTVSPIKLRDNMPWEMLDSHAEVDPNFANEILNAGHDLLQHEPLIEEYWTYFLESVRHGTPIGQSIAAARHRLEREHGWNLLELPLSWLCDTWEFGTFLAEVVSRAAQMRDIYNDARDEYRKLHRIRNEAHPVPALSSIQIENGEWCELPFWIYSEENPKRRQLWLRASGGRYSLSDREETPTSVSLGQEPKLSRDIWDSIVAGGIKIRPRALMTTTFLRLFAADLFVHGIGGGKYDQVTDRIISQMWGIVPPQFMIASASLHLPLFIKPVDQDFDSTHLQQQIREARFHPEKLLRREPIVSAEVEELLRRKQSLIESLPQSADIIRDSGTDRKSAAITKREWHFQMEEVNQALTVHLDGYLNELVQDLEHSHINQRQQKLLQSREFPFVLFSKTDAFRRLDQLLPEACTELENACDQDSMS
jgi:hypothetical protein